MRGTVAGIQECNLPSRFVHREIVSAVDAQVPTLQLMVGGNDGERLTGRYRPSSRCWYWRYSRVCLLSLTSTG